MNPDKEKFIEEIEIPKEEKENYLDQLVGQDGE